MTAAAGFRAEEDQLSHGEQLGPVEVPGLEDREAGDVEQGLQGDEKYQEYQGAFEDEALRVRRMLGSRHGHSD